MKNILIFLSIFGLTMLVTGCSSLFLQKVLFGVKEPKVITTGDMVSYLKKNDYSTENLYLLNPKAYVQLAEKSSKYFSTWEVFNQDGDLITPISDSVNSCIGNIYQFVQHLDDYEFNVDKTRNLNKDVIAQFDNNSDAHSMPSKKLDYTLVLYWSTFMGKYSKDVLNLEHLANQAKDRIVVIKVNMDLREDIEDFAIHLK